MRKPYNWNLSKPPGVRAKPFDERYIVDPATGCWVWQGDRRPTGYGYYVYRIGFGRGSRRRSVGAHRYAWERVHGPIAEGLEVCHKCDNPPCCNPGHLFVGTHSENTLDMVKKGRHALAKRTHCNHGHEYTPENTKIRPGNHGRECITCNKARLARLQARYAKWEDRKKVLGNQRVRARKTHCKKGHELTPENSHWREGGKYRACKACMADNFRRKYPTPRQKASA